MPSLGKYFKGQHFAFEFFLDEYEMSLNNDQGKGRNKPAFTCSKSIMET